MPSKELPIQFLNQIARILTDKSLEEVNFKLNDNEIEGLVNDIANLQDKRKISQLQNLVNNFSSAGNVHKKLDICLEIAAIAMGTTQEAMNKAGRDAAIESHNREAAREIDAKHRAEMQRNPTAYSLMPATETPAERAGREAAAASVKQINAMENKQHVTTPAKRMDKAPAYDTKAIRGKHPQVDLKGKGPANPVPSYGQAAAAAKISGIKKSTRESSSRRKHASSEQRQEAKAKKIFAQSKSSDEKSPRDIFKQAASTDNIRRGPGRK